MLDQHNGYYSFVHGALLKPLPYDEPGRRVYLCSRHFEQGREREGASLPDFFDWREGSDAFESLSAYGPMSFNLQRESGVERIPELFATADVLRTLRVAPALGRTFLPEETVPGNDRVVLMSDGVGTPLSWAKRYGSMEIRTRSSESCLRPLRNGYATAKGSVLPLGRTSG